ncbi:MAG: glycoside hydrolase [Acidobacteria bacterium]|nr:glycoside hydrolase [Acidobacteriota bacterium]
MDSRTGWVTEESCTIGADRQAYFVASASDTSSGRVNHRLGRTRLYHSRKSGFAWTDSLEVPFLDWTSATADATKGPFRGRFYVFANSVADGRGERLPERIALLTSLDQGRTLSSPVFAPTPTHNEYVRVGGAYPGSSAVLNDGTVLAVFASSRASQINGQRKHTVEVVRSLDGGQTLEQPVLIGERSNPSIGVSLGVDPRSQNLYVTWIEGDSRRRQLVLARSADRGRTWITRVVMEDEVEVGKRIAAGSPSVAVNRAGIVGLLWPAGKGRCARFAVSRDGGVSFSESRPLGPCEWRSNETFEYHDSFLQTSVPWFEISLKPSLDRLGISMRFLAPGSFLTSMDTDSKGVFHAVWQEWHGGKQQVWTSAVTVGPSIIQRLAIDELQDVTSKIEFEFANNRYDQATQTFFVDVILLNKGLEPINTPIRIQAQDLRSDLGAVEIDNADNRGRSDGAVWDVSDSVLDRSLMPGERSYPRTLGFRLPSHRPISAKGWINPVSVATRVFAKVRSPIQ